MTIEGYRLSPQQNRIWQVLQSGQSDAHHARCAILIEGQLNIDLLKLAIEQVVDRHEILRTTFQRLSGMDAPLQVINESGPVSLREYELAESSFDPEESEGLQTAVVTCSPFRHVLLVVLPSLCVDRISFENLTREISRSYAACMRGEVVEDEPTQYADISEVLNDLLESPETKTGREYWQKYVGQQPLDLHLPFVRESNISERFSPASSETHVVNQFDEAFMLACWATLLSRLSGQSELIVGAATDGRSYEALSDAIGPLAKFLPIRYQLTEDTTFSQVLAQTEETTSAHIKWQDFFTWEDLTVDKPFFAACFEFIDQTARFSDSNVTFSIEKQDICTERFKLKLVCIRKNDGLHIELHYDENLFEANTIKRLISEFQTLLASAATTPDSSISELQLVSEPELEQILIEFNRTNVNHGVSNRLHLLFEGQAKRTPENVAIAFADRCVTYAELNARANRLAYRLIEKGIGPEMLVAICVERSLEMIVGLLGILKAGGAYVPLDSTLPRERLAFLLDDAGPSVLLTQSHLKDQLPAHAATVLYLSEDDDIDLQRYATSPNRTISTDNAAYVIYTSGSTGKPKGVVVAHRAICNHMLWIQSVYPTTEADRFLQRTPFSFDASIWEIFAPLIAGAQLVLARPEDNKDMFELVQTILRYQITTLQLVPSLLGVLLDEPALGACSSLRRVFSGGERLSGELQEHFFTRLSADLYNLYGPTEAAINATSWACCRDASESTVPIGHPIDNIQIYILNSRLLPGPIGVTGVLHIGGEGLARGYLNRPDLTAEHFIPDPFSSQPGSRIYRTGDLARFGTEGRIEFVGRGDSQVKIRGFRIELGEIEALLATYPAVKASAVSMHEPSPGDRRLVAYFVLNQGWTATTTELRRFLSENLPQFMVPTYFVKLDQLPSLPNGKIDRRTLPAPEARRPDPEKGFVQPLTSIEKQLAQIWSQILGIEAVGVHDNFFDLGGDSILAIRVTAKANQQGLQLTPRQLFQNQTIAELGAIVGATETIQEEQSTTTGAAPLSPIQRRFFGLNQPDSHHYNQSVFLELRQELDSDLLRRAVGEIMRYHPALNMRFHESDSGWQQISSEPDGDIPFVRIDLTDEEDDEQRRRLESMANELQASLNLSDGLLLRVALFDLGANRSSRLLIIVHHLAVDIVSWGILLEDLQTAYRQLSSNEAVQLSKRTTPFTKWTEKLKAYSQSNELRAELEYWLAPPRASVTALPADRLSGANTIESASTVSASLDHEDTDALLHEVPKAYHTQIHEVLLTALVLAYARWTGAASMLVDVEGHGREEIFDDVDLSRTVGWFTAVFPLLLSVEGSDGPGDALKAVKEQVREVPHGGIGYGILRYMSDDAEITTQLEALPQANVIFNHMGQFDHVIDESSPFVPAKESAGKTFSPRRNRDHFLEINSGVSDGRLQVFWTYSENVHQRATIEKLAHGFIDELKSIINHCLSPDAGAYTPSDFPQAKLDIEKLNGILETVSFD
ncbi:MAG TPA: amino acid adenylation domain-containing protein [Pyrinomonadaceae bacterium]|nr:amino acid adenylation domain-containing protein [Pyrinomonadaceae bacterium]